MTPSPAATEDPRTFVIALVLAIGLHVALTALLPARATLSAPEIATVDMELLEPSAEEPPPIEEEPVEEEVEEIEEEPEPAPPEPPKADSLPPEPAPAAEKPAPEEAPEPPPVAFDNVVLTNEGSGSSWNVQQSSGIDRKGPISNPGRRPTGKITAPGGTGSGGRGTSVAPLSSLARKPKPPSSMAQRLERNYPPRARQQGIEGIAVVRLRINADGSVSNLRVASESVRGQGFGDACVRTLQGQRWSPPRSRTGRPVATIVPYRCTFRVRD